MDAGAQTVEVGFFSSLLEAHYDLRVRALRPLVVTAEKRAYRVETAHGGLLVLRASAQVRAAIDAQAHAATLTFLAGQRYPAARVVADRAGAAVVEAEGWQLLVTTFVEGAPLAFTSASLHLLGARLGELHALDPAAAARAVPPLRRAGMLPTNELAWALGQLRAVEALVPQLRRARYDWLLGAIDALDRCEGLPIVIIHNDAHPGNAIVAPDGEVVLIDWEGAGFGPAILDLGFLLSSAEIAPPWAPPLPPDPARLRAIIAGYRQHRQLNGAELARLPDAIRFRALVFGAVDFAARVRANTRDDELPWWLARYNAATTLAARAVEEFVRR